jgi:Asp-tRNA(Asn)/Glu-tRNA(Gln) amidotransferase A subunit family amidase
MTASIGSSACQALGIAGLAAAIALAAAPGGSGQTAQRFTLSETTVASIHAAIRSGELTCVQLVRMYLDRIQAYDSQGPALTAIINVNPRAEQEAAELDRKYRQDPGSAGSLHCIPIILKDNYNTFDMPTTGGNLTLRNSTPPEDAFTVKRMRAAGAIVLAKSNLMEFALGGTTVSGIRGQTLNPYDLKRTPGGSSGGTGAAIAANFAVLGTGSDTVQSTRSPASANNLVGIRPTRGLISRTGILPIGITQDEAGPITRTVEDAARMLDVMVGYDPEDPITGFGIGRTPRSYLDSLDRNGLKGARIGVMLDMFGKDPAVHGEVNRVAEEAILSMEDLGAAVVRFNFPDYASVSARLDNSMWEAKVIFDAYMAKLGPNAPAKSMADILAAGQVHPSVVNLLKQEAAVEDGLNSPDYKNTFLRRENFRLAVIKVMSDLNLDAILYPHQKRLVALVGQPQLERNGELSRGAGFPAITFQAGFSAPTETAPQGVPIGVEMVGREYSEPMLLKFAYAFEQATKHRKPPLSAPPLPSER